MNKKILVINPGSTSTKIAVYDGEQELFVTTLRHSTEEIGAFATIPDQKDFRRNLITEAMEAAGVKVSDLGAVIGRGGLIKHIPSGVYKVDAQMIDDIINRHDVFRRYIHLLHLVSVERYIMIYILHQLL